MTRRKVIALAALGVLALTMVLAIVVPPVQTRYPETGFMLGRADGVGLIRLSGPIQDSQDATLLGGAGITPALLQRRLERAEADARIRAVVLRIDTGGGTVAASQEMAAMISDFERPVVVSMGDMAASGGYYIASHADGIVAHPGTLTGSIGVIWTNFDIAGLLERFGVELETVTAGEHKDMFMPGRFTPERREIVQQMVDSMYDQFVAAVAAGRDMPEGDVRRLATGQLYTGQEALDLGLVDALGGVDEAIRMAEELAGIEDARLVELAPTFRDLLAAGPAIGSLRALVLGYLVGDEMALIHEALSGYNAPRYGG